MRSAILFVSLVLFLYPVAAQEEILLTIGGEQVTRSEFERIYNKNNNIEGYDQKEPAEYLNLFINYKLKVLEAKSRGYDTVASFRTELAGYREQLVKPYLQDRQVIDRQVREVYDRTANEVNASHIMIRLNQNPSAEDTIKAYREIMEIKTLLDKGEPFDKLARERSQDPSAKSNNGQLGWFSAFRMVYPFEEAAYNTPVGGVSGPVRTRYGYHLILVNGFRPALGEIHLAHIMIRAARTESAENIVKARQRIDSCLALLNQGVSFAEVARTRSEDPNSARNGGQLRWLRSGELPPSIEEVVYAMQDSGSISQPIQSDYGWHIFQLLGTRGIGTFEQMRSQLEEKIMSDERGKASEESVIRRLIKETPVEYYPENLQVLVEAMDSSVYFGKWNPDAAGVLIDPVFSIDNNDVSQHALAAFIAKTKQYRRDEPISALVLRKQEELLNRELLRHEKEKLEEKYPEFRHLMQEYHDGILFFNITDEEVWSRAVKDSAGLEAFFEQHRSAYRWNERISVTRYSITGDSLAERLQKLAKKRLAAGWTDAEMITRVCGSDTIPCLSISQVKKETGDPAIPLGMASKKGSMTWTREKDAKVLWVSNGVLPPGEKELDEVRGQAIADYQNYLDQEWIARLRAKYAVVIDQAVLQLVK